MTHEAFDEHAFGAALSTRSLGRALHYEPVVDSTMRLAREAADAGEPHGTLFLAEEQTAGKGRQGRSFYSPAGENLYFTMILRGAAPALRTVPLAAPLAVVRAVRELDVDALIKWPNDIWVDGRKLCGILIDAEGTGERLVVMPGIGINVNTDFSAVEDLRETATSVRASLGKAVAREQLLASVCNHLESLLGAETGPLIGEYRRLSLVLGREIEVIPRAGEPFAAVAGDVQDDGALVVRLADGTARVVQAADVSLRPREGGVDLSH